jgi:hypothetical protein
MVFVSKKKLDKLSWWYWDTNLQESSSTSIPSHTITGALKVLIGNYLKFIYFNLQLYNCIHLNASSLLCCFQTWGIIQFWFIANVERLVQFHPTFFFFNWDCLTMSPPPPPYYPNLCSLPLPPLVSSYAFFCCFYYYYYYYYSIKWS